MRKSYNRRPQKTTNGYKTDPRVTLGWIPKSPNHVIAIVRKTGEQFDIFADGINDFVFNCGGAQALKIQKEYKNNRGYIIPMQLRISKAASNLINFGRCDTTSPARHLYEKFNETILENGDRVYKLDRNQSNLMSDNLVINRRK